MPRSRSAQPSPATWSLHGLLACRWTDLKEFHQHFRTDGETNQRDEEDGWWQPCEEGVSDVCDTATCGHTSCGLVTDDVNFRFVFIDSDHYSPVVSSSIITPVTSADCVSQHLGAQRRAALCGTAGSGCILFSADPKSRASVHLTDVIY